MDDQAQLADIDDPYAGDVLSDEALDRAADRKVRFTIHGCGPSACYVDRGGS